MVSSLSGEVSDGHGVPGSRRARCIPGVSFERFAHGFELFALLKLKLNCSLFFVQVDGCTRIKRVLMSYLIQ